MSEEEEGRNKQSVEEKGQPEAKKPRVEEEEEEVKDDEKMTEEEMLIKDEHSIWQKNSPFLYDFIVNYTLDWPSLTVQWLPGSRDDPDSASVFRRVLVGTHTNREETDYLKILEVCLPASLVKAATNDSASAAPATVNNPGITGGLRTDRVCVVQAIPHDGEINRARYMPQCPSIIATLSPAEDGGAQAFIFSTARHPPFPEDEDHAVPSPDAVLKGIHEEGYGLAWSPLHEGMLASGCNDGNIIVWRIDANSCDKNEIQPLNTTQHGSVVEEVAWHPHDGNVLASVGDDSVVRLWDIRDMKNPAAVHTKRHGNSECNSISFSSKWEYLYVTGGADNNVTLWDSRKADLSLHTMEHHQGAVFQVHWSRENENIIASTATDRRVMMWDISKIGDEQSADDANDGPPELLFVHSGHTAGVSEFSMCPDCSWRIASVDSNNSLQIWQPPQNIHSPDDLSKPSTIPASDLE